MDLWGDKRHRITISGEPIADLDFVSMFAMLAYVSATGRLPSGDPYAVPGLEHHRDAAKLGVLSLLSRSNAMKRLSPELKAALPDGWTASDLVEAMSWHHPRISHLFGSDIGIELMNTESSILMAVLTELAERGVPALGMHDGINVRHPTLAWQRRRWSGFRVGCSGWRCPSGRKPCGGRWRRRRSVSRANERASKGSSSH